MNMIKSILKKPFAWIVLFVLIGGVYAAINPDVLGFLVRTEKETVSLTGEAAAVVNGKTVTKIRLEEIVEILKRAYQAEGRDTQNEEVIKEIKDRAIQEAVGEALLLQYAEKQGIQIEGEKVEVGYQNTINSFESPEAFQQEMKTLNLTEQDVRESIASQLTLSEVISQYLKDKNISVSDEEVRARYDIVSPQLENPPSFEEVKAQIEQTLQQEKIGQLVSELVNRLRSEGVIEIVQ